MAFNRKQIIEFPFSTFGQAVGFVLLSSLVVIFAVPVVNKLVAKAKAKTA